jgi:hypothetical protein
MIDGHRLLMNSAELTAITGELRRIEKSGRLATDSGWLLSVLHTTRALDTTLAELCRARKWSRPDSLGGALHALLTNKIISASAKQAYQRTIVDPRNRYMHRAGAMPQKRQADQLLAEMQSCLAAILPNI